MAKTCTICSETQEVQNKILEWHKDGKSYRDIETMLENECKITISNSSIRRHIINCLEEKEGSHETAPSFQDIVSAPKPDGADMHNALCHILQDGIQMFFQRMKETTEKTTPYSVHLETYRCLDMLIKMLEALYPNSAQLAENKGVFSELCQF
jgi:23S rRNA maturation mini-RNase III